MVVDDEQVAAWQMHDTWICGHFLELLQYVEGIYPFTYCLQMHFYNFKTYMNNSFEKYNASCQSLFVNFYLCDQIFEKEPFITIMYDYELSPEIINTDQNYS